MRGLAVTALLGPFDRDDNADREMYAAPVARNT